ncbi:MAG: PhoU domain-containing protein [Candidatus Omnitrophica bacterium]|nr:PhoU domain-containing protein [Candidatus Omnitrophota bacterium]
MHKADAFVLDKEKEFRKLNDELLKGCRLTQEAISKTAGVLMNYDAQKMQEITDNNKKIGVLYAAFEVYCANAVKQREPESAAVRLLSSGLSIYAELKEISLLTVRIAESLPDLNPEIRDKYKINIAQFVKIFQNVTWNAVFSFLKQDTEFAKRTISASLELKRICHRMRGNISGTDGLSESVTDSSSSLLFIIQRVEDIAVHTVCIAQNVLCP